MRKYLDNYIKETNSMLNNNKTISEDEINKHLIKIQFFQHERLIHLLVTLFYALLFLLFMILGFIHIIFFSITIILLIFLLCYIIYYFYLENKVQYLYRLYDKMIKKNTK